MAVVLRRGDKRHRITLMSPSTAVDALGQATEVWTDVATVWAAAEPIRGREFFAAAQAQSQVQTRFRIDWRPDVLESWRVRWGLHVYELASVIDTLGERVQLELMAFKTDAPGLVP